LVNKNFKDLENNGMLMERKTAYQSLINLIGVPVEQKTVHAGNIKTNYLEAGKGQPLIFLHGAGAGAVTWYKTIGPLSSHFHVIAPDVVGYGESDKPSAPYDRPYFSAWLKDFADELGVEKASVVGNSQGGAIAIQYTLDNPHKVDRLVLVGSGGLGKGIPPGAFLGFLWLNMLPSNMASKWMARYLFYNPKSADEAYRKYSVEVCRMPGGNRVFFQGRGRAVSPIPAEELRKISQPTLIIWGREERFFPLAHAEAAHEAIPNSQLHVIPKAGHLPFIDQPELFNDALIKFLKE
jgi:4,5:9,10-diseco-3-hydroxy-5,9,17-trioxoandrosta-1(10),2-diene-4-oate hydrolase